MAKGKGKNAKGRRAKASSKVYVFEVDLASGPVTEEFAETNPVVSRTIEMRGRQTLDDLHELIFEAFDRWEEHLYEFQFGKRPCDRNARRYCHYYAMEEIWPIGDPPKAAAETTIDSLKLKSGTTFWYWFDFGDDWWHRVKVVRIGEAEKGARYPRITERIGESPPQYPGMEEEDEEEWDMEEDGEEEQESEEYEEEPR